MKRLSVSKHGSIDSSEQLVVTCRHTSTRGTVRALALLVYRPKRDIAWHVRWSVKVSYAVDPPLVTATFRGNGSSAPGVGNVFGKV